MSNGGDQITLVVDGVEVQASAGEMLVDFRTRVLGIAVVLTLVQFFVNLLGQTWQAIDFLRPWTVFYYYQPQGLILGFEGAINDAVRNCLTLLGIGAAGYAAALAIFCRRDLPAPL